MKKIVIAICLASSLSACARYDVKSGWTRDNTTFQQFSQDKEECMIQSVAMAPIKVQTIHTVNPYWAGAANADAAYPEDAALMMQMAREDISQDVNQGMRKELFDTCLQSKGYQFKTKKTPNPNNILNR